jgi:hypothetical protein
MNLTDQDISKFEQTLHGPPPDWDPDWKIAITLLDAVRVQSAQILTLSAQLRTLDFGHDAAEASLAKALRLGLTAGVAGSGLTDAQVASAVGRTEPSAQGRQKWPAGCSVRRCSASFRGQGSRLTFCGTGCQATRPHGPA